MCAFTGLLFIGTLGAALFVVGRELIPPRPDNSAFDEYRADTLRGLEDEQREFQGFVDRTRAARDKAEFDQFMKERRRAVA